MCEDLDHILSIVCDGNASSWSCLVKLTLQLHVLSYDKVLTLVPLVAGVRLYPPGQHWCLEPLGHFPSPQRRSPVLLITLSLCHASRVTSHHRSISVWHHSSLSRVTVTVWSDKSCDKPLSATHSHYHALTVKLKTTILRLIVSTHNRSWPLGDTLCAHDIKLSGPEQWNRNDRNRFTGFQDAISNGNSALSGYHRDTTRNCHWSINSSSLTTDYKVVMRMCHVVPVCGDNGTSGEWCIIDRYI